MIKLCIGFIHTPKHVPHNSSFALPHNYLPIFSFFTAWCSETFVGTATRPWHTSVRRKDHPQRLWEIANKRKIVSGRKSHEKLSWGLCRSPVRNNKYKIVESGREGHGPPTALGLSSISLDPIFGQWKPQNACALPIRLWLLRYRHPGILAHWALHKYLWPCPSKIPSRLSYLPYTY